MKRIFVCLIVIFLILASFCFSVAAFSDQQIISPAAFDVVAAPLTAEFTVFFERDEEGTAGVVLEAILPPVEKIDMTKIIRSRELEMKIARSI